jgi:hypothetical protein
MLKKLKHNDFYIQKLNTLARIVGMTETGVAVIMYFGVIENKYSLEYPEAKLYDNGYSAKYRYDYDELFHFTDNVKNHWKWRKLKKNEYEVTIKSNFYSN